MDKKSSSETSRRSPYFCCPGLYPSTFIRTALLSAIFLLCVSFVALLLCGVFYASGSSIFFYVSATIMLSAAAMLTLFYIWLNRRSIPIQLHCPSSVSSNKAEIATVTLSEYYSQTPTGMKSDYPMGPNLVMTLPKPSNGRDRSPTLDSEDYSVLNTPKYAKKKISFAKRAKNVPPLASAETLTPSLMSSCYGSIDSVV